MRTLITILTIVAILLIAGCSKSESDAITGAVVSEQQAQQQPKISQQPQQVETETNKQIACTDECSEDGCNGWKFVKCEVNADGCKDKIEVGLTNGKCGIQCLSDADCNSQQKCTVNYECKDPEPIIHSMGEDVAVDDLVYKVTKSESFTKMGTSLFEKTTIGKFIKVYLKITNAGKETQQIFTPRFKLIDSQDRRFDRVSDDTFYISDGINFGEQLQPGLPLEGAIVFELPKDSTDLKLEISGDWTSVSKVVIAIDNVRSINTDTTLKAEQAKVWGDAMAEGEKKMDEIMSKCNSPLKCSSSCAAYSDVGQKDCPSGQVCCMTEQAEVDKQMEEYMQDYQKQMDDLFKQFG